MEVLSTMLQRYWKVIKSKTDDKELVQKCDRIDAMLTESHRESMTNTDEIKHFLHWKWKGTKKMSMEPELASLHEQRGHGDPLQKWRLPHHILNGKKVTIKRGLNGTTLSFYFCFCYLLEKNFQYTECCTKTWWYDKKNERKHSNLHLTPNWSVETRQGQKLLKCSLSTMLC